MVVFERWRLLEDGVILVMKEKQELMMPQRLRFKWSVVFLFLGKERNCEKKTFRVN
jgi:hypothetical protein